MQHSNTDNITRQLNYLSHITSMKQSQNKEPGNPGCLEEIHKKVIYIYIYNSKILILFYKY